MTEHNENDAPLKHTPLCDFHIASGARMVPFAGYLMPVQYKEGIIAEHNWTRNNAGLFDVSHMGLVKISGENAATAIEKVTVGDFANLPKGKQKYSYFTNEEGGILDDIMVSNYGDFFLVVVNAGCKEADIAMLNKELGGMNGVELEVLPDYALLALQGPKAREVLSVFNPEVDQMSFMEVQPLRIMNEDCFVSCSGYTGEDGYEIAIPKESAEEFVKALLANENVKLIGLGARDTLRLEAGLPLYGNDITLEITPVMAGLEFAISKKRREQCDFKGAEIILGQLKGGVSIKLVGLLPKGRAPLRSHTEIYPVTTPDLEAGLAEENNETENVASIGVITSGSFSPTLGSPIALALIDDAYAQKGNIVEVDVRGTRILAEVVSLPFVPHNYWRKTVSK